MATEIYLTNSDPINFGKAFHPDNCQVFITHHSCQEFGPLVIAYYLEFFVGGLTKKER